MILSILIPSMHKRSGMLAGMLKLIGSHPEVEVLTNIDDGRKSTGRKRNELIERSTGDYFVFIDDDDYITPEYIPEIIAAAKHNPDVICFNGWMTTKGLNRKDFYFSINYPYTQAMLNGKMIYTRYPNHLCPMRRELVKHIKFVDITIGEDYIWATEIHKLGLLKKQIIIPKFIYHYQYNPIK